MARNLSCIRRPLIFMDEESFCIDQCENEDIDTQEFEKDRHNTT